MLWRCDLVPQFEGLRRELLAAAERVLASGRYVLADEGHAFETEFAADLGSPHAVAVNSGTDALVLALRARGIGPGDEVITTPFTAIPTCSAIRQVGAIPVFVDIDPQTFLLDVDQVPAVVTPRTRAVVPVHLFGNVVDVELLRARVGPQIFILEDCAQAHGARLRGRAAGTLGDAGAFSFYPTKNLGACGDGGAVATGDAELAARMRRLRMYGMVDKDNIVEDGTNSRLDELQAAFLRVKLPHLARWNAQRRTLAARYHELLPTERLTPQAIRPGVEPVWHVFAARCPTSRDALLRDLDERNIQANVYYPRGLHQQAPYRDLLARLGPTGAPPCPPLPHTERLCREVIALPFYPEIPAEHLERVADVARASAVTASRT